MKVNIISQPHKYSFLFYVLGEIYPSFIKESTLEEIRNFKLRPDDVFIATYPKNGTTWTQGLIQKLHAAHKTGYSRDIVCDALIGLVTHVILFAI